MTAVFTRQSDKQQEDKETNIIGWRCGVAEILAPTYLLAHFKTKHRQCYSTRWAFHISQLPNICTAHPGTSTRPRPDSLLVSATVSAHFVPRHEWRHEWQHGGFCPFRRSFGCVFLLNQIFRKQCTIRQYTTLIYLINLLWKLGLGLGLDSELHYFSIFTENKKNEHLIFCECHGR